MRLTIVNAVADLDVAGWDRLAIHTGGLYTGSEWLGFSEAVEPDLDAYYLQVHDATGFLRAALPVFRIGRPDNARYSADRLFDDVPEGTDDQPHLLIGGSRGYHADLLIAAGDPDQARLVDLILGGVDRLGDQLDTTSWGLWTYVPTRLAVTLRRRYGCEPRLVGGEGTIGVGSAGWAGYLAGLPGSRRTKVRRERSRFTAAGLRIVDLPLRDCLEDVGRLMATTQRRYGFAVDITEMTDLMRTQNEAFHGRGTVHCCLSGNTIIGCAIFYDFGDTYYGRAVGFDYPVLPGAGEYFELSIYHAVERAASLGLSRLHLGKSSYHAKTNRGARISPLWAVATSADAWDTAVARAGNSKAAGAILQEIDRPERALLADDRSWVSGVATLPPGPP